MDELILRIKETIHDQIILVKFLNQLKIKNNFILLNTNQQNSGWYSHC